MCQYALDFEDDSTYKYMLENVWLLLEQFFACVAKKLSTGYNVKESSSSCSAIDCIINSKKRNYNLVE